MHNIPFLLFKELHYHHFFISFNLYIYFKTMKQNSCFEPEFSQTEKDLHKIIGIVKLKFQEMYNQTIILGSSSG